MKKTKRAFTLVELIIVIAVIGVLAAILIPVFANVIRKANEANDLSAVRNMNMSLRNYATDNSVETISDVMRALLQGGIGTDALVCEENSFAWDSINNRSLYRDADGKVLNFTDADPAESDSWLPLDFTETPINGNSSTYSELFGLRYEQ